MFTGLCSRRSFLSPRGYAAPPDVDAVRLDTHDLGTLAVSQSA
jgi:hypothetical protein